MYYKGENTKSIISQKLRIAKKNHLCKKWASCQFQSTLQIWPLLKKVKFLTSKNAPFRHPWRPNAIWNFTPIFIFSTFSIFYVKMATSEEGGGVCISVVGTGPAFFFLQMIFAFFLFCKWFLHFFFCKWFLHFFFCKWFALFFLQIIFVFSSAKICITFPAELKLRQINIWILLDWTKFGL